MPHEEMKSLGEVLKTRRKEINMSLKEVENATSIRLNYLQAIEEGDVSKLISPIYAQGFLKQYATFLGIDGDKIIKDNPELFTRVGVQDFSYGIGTLEVRGNPGAGIKWLPNALWIGGFGLVCLLAWAMARYLEVL